MPDIFLPAVAVTPAGGECFFGYYTHSQWNSPGTWLLAHRTQVAGRMPAAGEEAEILLIDSATGHGRPVARTRAWNWQTGSNLQWLGPDHFVHNDVGEEGFVACVRDLEGGLVRQLPRALCESQAATGQGLSIDFARLAQARPVLGYAHDQAVDLTAVPDDDGVWLVDLRTGDSRLLISLAACVAVQEGADYDISALPPQYAGRPGFEQPATGHRIGGAQFSPSGRYVLVSHHWPRRQPLELPHFQRHVWDRKIVCDVQTGKRWLLGPDGFYSHNVWLADDNILMWGIIDGEAGLFEMPAHGRGPNRRVHRQTVLVDPHASVSPDGRWLLADGYPVEGRRPLYLVERATDRRLELGRYPSPAPYDRGPLRCDLHPRWHPAGGQISFDSVHEGARASYRIDLRPLLEA